MDPHERMIQSTQLKMLRFIVQTTRKYEKKTQSKDENKAKEETDKLGKMKDGKEDEENQGSSEDETEDGHSSNTNCDQDSDISFMNDTDEEMDTAVIEEEDWIVTTHGSKWHKNRERGISLESEYAMTAEERSVDSLLRRENPPRDPIRPARYLNGVKLDDDEVSNIILFR